jgi:hypothetical protein
MNIDRDYQKKSYSLFKSDIDWWHNACLNFCPDKFGLYASGYKKAGDLLVAYVIKERINQDILVYPIVFLYRHYIELRLKELIRKGNLLLDSPGRFPQHHLIDKLWSECRKILKKIWPEENADDLNEIEKYINDFSECDPTSTAFRYPKDKKDKESLSGLTHINLRGFSDVILKISSLLDGADLGISCELDNKNEFNENYPF